MVNPNVGRKFFEGLANDEWLVSYNELDDDDDNGVIEEEEDEQVRQDPFGDKDPPLPGDVRGLMYKQVFRIYGRL